MAQNLKFNGKLFGEFRPMYKSKYGNRYSMPKGLPALPKPIPIENISNEPKTEELMDLDKVRKLKPNLTGLGFCAVVIDSGVYQHELLSGNIRLRLSANGDKDDVNDYYGHGTHMAGIIAAKTDQYSCMGIAPEAGIISIKVTNKRSGSASWKSIYIALELVNKLLDQSEDNFGEIGVVNISFNGLDAQSDSSKVAKNRIFTSINKLAERNIPVVVSAGNAFEFITGDGLGYPAFHNKVIAAGAHLNYEYKGLPDESIAPFSQRYLSPFTSFQPGMFKTVNERLIFAPGGCSVSLNNSNTIDKRFSITSGTSVSAAIISGSIMLMQQKWRMKGNTGLMPLDQLKDALNDGCEVFQNLNYTASAAIAQPSPTRTYDLKRYTRLNILKTLSLI